VKTRKFDVRNASEREVAWPEMKKNVLQRNALFEVTSSAKTLELEALLMDWDVSMRA